MKNVKAYTGKKGQRLWERAKEIIPGGNQLLSKRAEMFLPEQWPAYYSKAKGAYVWDLEGNKLIDFSIMGVGSSLLGYNDPDVNRAVKKAVDAGIVSTLNSPEEVELAELLCKIHPWGDMVRYTRSGGEAMAVAVRIARAHTSRDIIAFCGYHGWQDWYLSANLADDKALDGHLLPGLEPNGVPRALKGSMLPFHYNKIEELEEIIKSHGDRIAAIVMEPMKSVLPEHDFLQKVRSLADSSGAVLIFDEITTGWKLTLGGVHLLHKVFPDIAVFSKAMSNGYAMAAIVGRRDVMQSAQTTFISSTTWTERIGPAAALATIKKLKQLKVAERLQKVGTKVKKIWHDSAQKHGLEIVIAGLPPLASFSFSYGDTSQAMKTLFVQEMLDRGYLATNAVFATYAHTDALIGAYGRAVDASFAVIKQGLDEGTIEKRLRGPIAHSGFARLN